MSAPVENLTLHDSTKLLFGRKEHLLIHVSGIVQGVGFRPFVYRLARELGVSGTVRNHSGGVEIHAEAPREVLREFAEGLRDHAPKTARVADIVNQRLDSAGFPDFRIIESETRSGQFTQLPADLALCEDCRRELLDPADRRYRYPFINCTNCGPRFTIIRGLPYDRPDTTMVNFAMCPACAAEYHDPQNRRYHAQPSACPDCGPRLSYLEKRSGNWEQAGRDDEALLAAVSALQEGRIVLVHGVGGFHLACDARDPGAIRALRRRKRREEKPFAVMFASIEDIENACELSALERGSLMTINAPIVLLKRKNGSGVAQEIAPRNPLIGAMLPYMPLHVLLLNDFHGPLVMTSANLSEEPMAFEPQSALGRMREIADSALVHDRPIHLFADDSIVRCMGGAARVVRRARGYVPQPIEVGQPFRFPVLAFGADLKNTFCLGSGRAAILSQHLGDLESDAAIASEQGAMDHFLKLFSDHVRVAACDLHPDYQSTRLAEEWSTANEVPLIRVQHHHAHLASCLAENANAGPAVGLCLDGTGYGTDGKVWGGEVLTGDFSSFVRVGCLHEVPMPGGEAAAREPWRMAVAWLHATFGDSFRELDISFVDELRKHKSRAELCALTQRKLMERVYPQTTSAGRLFDALSALTGFQARSQFEGQAAMEFESLAGDERQAPYAFHIERCDSLFVIDPRPMFREIVHDLRRGVTPGKIAAGAHEAIAEAFSVVAIRAARAAHLETVCLSGGCFQNRRLLSSCERYLSEAGLRVLTQSQVPANDGGISLGQACIANAQAE